MVDTDDAPLGRAYRAVRAVRAHEDGPWPGTLVRTDDGASRILVDAAVLGTDWAGWEADPEGHVLAALDVTRRAGGHDAVLPVCLERLDDFVRRRQERMPLTPGEAVTLGVSVLRGCAQLAGVAERGGQWWLDDAGRPVLATDASDSRALDASVAVLERVTPPPVMQRTWDAAVRTLGADRVSVAELAAAEDALFALSPAEPLVTVSLSPRRASEGMARSSAAGERPRVVHEPPPRSMWQSLLRGVDEELADTVSRATTAVWRRVRPGDRPARATSRRAPWLVAGAVAAAVLAGGALWPSADVVATGGPAASTPAATAGAGTQVAVPAAGPDADSVEDVGASPGTDAEAAAAPAAAPADLAAIAGGLLDARLACGADAECLRMVVVDGAAIADGAIDLPADERTVTMLDDFGDLAVVRVDPDEGGIPSQLVVILRHEEKWLLRDVRDVAQQP